MRAVLVTLALLFAGPVLESQELLKANATPEEQQAAASYRVWQDQLQRDLCLGQYAEFCPPPRDTIVPRPSPTEKPIISLKPGTYSVEQTVTLLEPRPGAVIYYTLDGRKPTSASLRYETPLAIAGTTTLKALAIAPGHSPSKIVTAKYKWRPAKSQS